MNESSREITLVNDADECIASQKQWQKITCAKIKADKIIKEAQVKANQIIEDARQQSFEILEDAKKQGFNEGIAEGAKSVEITALQQKEKIDSMITYIMEHREEIFNSYKENMIDIALTTAKKIIAAQVNVNEKLIVGLFEKVIEEYKDEKNIVVHISEYIEPLELKVDQNIANIIKSVADNVSVVIEKGQDVCKVETTYKVIDVSIDTQLQLIRECIINAS